MHRGRGCIVVHPSPEESELVHKWAHGLVCFLVIVSAIRGTTDEVSATALGSQPEAHVLLVNFRPARELSLRQMSPEGPWTCEDALSSVRISRVGTSETFEIAAVALVSGPEKVAEPLAV